MDRSYVDCYLSLGWRVLPVKVDKTPLTQHGMHDATNDPEVIQTWHARWPKANIGIATGLVSGIAVLDIDARSGGFENLERLIATYGELPPTPRVRTGGGGVHYYFRLTTPVRSRQIALGIDLKAEGGYVVAPPSQHPSGGMYTWEVHPTEIPLADLPDWVVVQKVSLPSLSEEYDKIPIGRRNDSLFALALKLRRLGLSERGLYLSLRAINESVVEQRPNDRIEDNELAELAHRVVGYDLHMIDDAFVGTEREGARVLAKLIAGKYTYCPELNAWYFWNGRHWHAVTTERARPLRLVEPLVIYLDFLARDLIDQGDERSVRVAKEYRAWAFSLQSLAKRQSTLRLAEEESCLKKSIHEYDQDPLLLNCENGVVDLRTGALYLHTSSQLMMHYSPVAYRPDARSEIWQAFLDRVTNGDSELASYLQLMAGYCATGLTDEEQLWLLLGPAATGKTTFVQALKLVLGSYAWKSNHRFFMQSSVDAEGATPELASLPGRRLVIATELPATMLFNSSLLKELTGGDEITARPLYCAPFSFRPVCKVLMAANEPPRASVTDSGLWRRLRQVPFENEIPENERDPRIKKALTEDPTSIHAQAVLAWVVEGAMRWCKGERIKPIAVVNERTEEFRDEQNPLSLFLSEWCEFDGLYEEPKDRLWQSYLSFCESYRQRPIDIRYWGRVLRSYKIRIERRRMPGGGQKDVVIGLRLIRRPSDSATNHELGFNTGSSEELEGPDPFAEE